MDRTNRSGPLADIILVVIAVVGIGVIVAAEPKQDVPVVQSDEWVAIQHESGAVWIFRKQAIIGFKKDGELRNQVILNGGVQMHTALGVDIFKKVMGIKEEDIREVTTP